MLGGYPRGALRMHHMPLMPNHRLGGLVAVIHHGSFSLQLCAGVNGEDSVGYDFLTFSQAILDNIRVTKGRA